MLNCSVWSQYYKELTPEEKIDRFLAAGFTATEFSDEDGFVLLARDNPIAEAKKLKALADSKGFSYPQGHLFLTVDICKEDSVDALKQWLDLFNALGIRSSVLHAAGGKELSDSERFEKRVATLSTLADYIKGSGMTICLENLYGASNPHTVEDLLALIDAAGGADELGICLDTGHLNIIRENGVKVQTHRDFILKSGKRLKALHIADNEGVSDQHLVPFARGTVDMNEVITALCEVGYDRLFNFEIPGETCRCPIEVRDAKLRYIRAMCDYMFKVTSENSRFASRLQ